MMRRVAVTLSIAALFLFGSRTAAADDVVDALLSVPGLTILNDQPVAPGLRLLSPELRAACQPSSPVEGHLRTSG